MQAAINVALLDILGKKAKAPIFQAADVGIVDDLLGFLPALTERVREECCAPGKERRK